MSKIDVEQRTLASSESANSSKAGCKVSMNDKYHGDYPESYVSLFEDEIQVCRWLLTGLYSKSDRSNETDNH